MGVVELELAKKGHSLMFLDQEYACAGAGLRLALPERRRSLLLGGAVN